MKITKAKLKELIKEEFEKLFEEPIGDMVGTTAAKKQIRQKSMKDIGSAGVTNQERGIILTLQNQLLSLSKEGTLVPVMTLLKQLSKKLSELGHSGEEEAPVENKNN